MENKNSLKDTLKGKAGIIGEFKTFIARGNVLDMAVGLIVGSAFTAIVTSLVNDIITPLIGAILAGIDFKSLTITIPWGGEPVILIGAFINAILNFFITAACVFLIVKTINKFSKKKEEEEAPAPAQPSEDILLLQEIRDLLKEQNK